MTGIFVEGSDVTDRVVQAQRLAALSDLSEQLRDLDDADAVVHAAAACLANMLGATRTGFGTVRLEDETILVAARLAPVGRRERRGAFIRSARSAATSMS